MNRRWLAVTFALIAIMASIDIVADVAEGETSAAHFLVEGVIVVLGLSGLVFLGLRLQTLWRTNVQLGRERLVLDERLRASHEEAQRWKAEAAVHLDGLGQSIDRQFQRWGLTQAEAEVALLLLKGLSHKEIGAVREVSEATVRQQGQAVYRKAGVAGRRDLSAFFLEDLLLPNPTKTA